MQETRESFFQEVLENVRNISIRDLILNVYELQPGLCPFHNDRTPGSFSVIDRKRKYYCWSCGEQGDAIKFVRETEGIGFPEAVFKIALIYGIVTEEQVALYNSGSTFKEETTKIVRSYDNLWKNSVEDHRAEPDVISNVLDIFSQGESVIEGSSKKLSTKHLEHLKQERLLTDEEIEKVGYFSIPSRSSRYLKHFLQALEDEYGYDQHMLKGVPGFYKKKGDVSKRAYTFLSIKGIGIPIRDLHGKIQGIQIRKDIAKKGEKRYIWMSSSFANDEDTMEFGTGSGSPIHVSIPSKNKYPYVLFITEGIFKSEAIAKHYQAQALSIQGIQNWKQDLIHTIHDLEEQQNHPFLNIIVMFDSDVASNINVFESLSAMVEAMKEFDVKIHYAWWEKDFGKGIDDVIQSGYQDKVNRISADTFVSTYRSLIDEIEEMHGMKIRDVLKEFGNELIEEGFDDKIKPLFLKQR